VALRQIGAAEQIALAERELSLRVACAGRANDQQFLSVGHRTKSGSEKLSKQKHPNSAV
jgi:hypothetical protein